MATVFHAWPFDRFTEMQNFIERIKASNFLEAVLAIQIMSEPESNLQKKVNPRILKGDFPPRTDPSIFTSIAPVLSDCPNKPS